MGMHQHEAQHGTHESNSENRPGCTGLSIFIDHLKYLLRRHDALTGCTGCADGPARTNKRATAAFVIRATDRAASILLRDSHAPKYIEKNTWMRSTRRQSQSLCCSPTSEYPLLHLYEINANAPQSGLYPSQGQSKYPRFTPTPRRILPTDSAFTQGETYPAIIPYSKSREAFDHDLGPEGRCVRGTLVTGLTTKDIDQLDLFEGEVRPLNNGIIKVEITY
jgi:hypothetical protein